MKFYKIDDQIIISDKELSVGTELIANTVDAAQEKHVPVITVNGDEVKVAVGSVEHPSLPVENLPPVEHRVRASLSRGSGGY